MKTTKIITIITGLLVLVTITGVGIFSGNTNLLIAPGFAVVVALFNAKHIFDDPDTITEIKAEHADEIREMQHAQADLVAKHRQAIAAKDAEINAAGVSAIQEKTKRIEAEHQLSIYKPRPPGPDGRMIAPVHPLNTGRRPPPQE